MIYATITVYRGDEEIEVELGGHTEYFGSYNPYERGIGLSDWSVCSPKDFDLTKEEQLEAEQALCDAIWSSQPKQIGMTCILNSGKKLK